jgi:ATP-dependent protease HslVU (ClpYQ) peptidase subunit
VTTISYKDGIMAAEGKMTLGDMVIKLDTEKVFWVNNHLVGVCGRARAINTFVTWLQKMTDYHIVNQEVGELVDLVPPALEDDEGYSALVVTPSRQVLMYEGNTPIDMGLDVPMSVGSGSCFALAAMKAGNSAEEAVKVACSLDVYSGGEITVVQLEDEPEPLTREVAENLSKEELIELMFGEEEESATEVVVTKEDFVNVENFDAVGDNDFDDNLTHIYSWADTIVLWQVKGTKDYIFEVIGGGYPVGIDTLKGFTEYAKSNMNIEELRDICNDMQIDYIKSNTQQQLIQKIFKEVKSKIPKQ